MAAPSCMSNDGQQAVFVGTMLATGDAVALCDECLVMWSAALLQAMTGVDPTPFLQAISEPDGAEFGGMGESAPADGPPVERDAPTAPTDEPPGVAPADGDQEADVAPTPIRPRSGRSRGGSPGAGMGTAQTAAASPPGSPTTERAAG
jgi:hypothetical protein